MTSAKKYLLSVSLLLISISAYPADDQSDKYADFELEVIYGTGIDETRGWGKYQGRAASIPNELNETIDNHYGEELRKLAFPDGFDGPVVLGFPDGFVEYLPRRYFSFGSIRVRGPNGEKLTTALCYPDYKKPESAKHCNSYYVGVVEADTGNFYRLDEIGDHGMGAYNLASDAFRSHTNTYGCYPGTATHASDLNIDGVPELFFISGEGAIGANGQQARTRFNIFRLTDGEVPKKVLETALSEEWFGVDGPVQNSVCEP